MTTGLVHVAAVVRLNRAVTVYVMPPAPLYSMSQPVPLPRPTSTIRLQPENQPVKTLPELAMASSWTYWFDAGVRTTGTKSSWQVVCVGLVTPRSQSIPRSLLGGLLGGKGSRLFTTRPLPVPSPTITTVLWSPRGEQCSVPGMQDSSGVLEEQPASSIENTARLNGTGTGECVDMGVLAEGLLP